MTRRLPALWWRQTNTRQSRTGNAHPLSGLREAPEKGDLRVGGAR